MMSLSCFLSTMKDGNPLYSLIIIFTLKVKYKISYFFKSLIVAEDGLYVIRRLLPEGKLIVETEVGAVFLEDHLAFVDAIPSNWHAFCGV